MRYWVAILLAVTMSAAATAGTDIMGKIGKNITGFTGRLPIAGGIGNGGSPPPPTCGVGAIDLSAGCSLPMLGGL